MTVNGELPIPVDTATADEMSTVAVELVGEALIGPTAVSEPFCGGFEKHELVPFLLVGAPPDQMPFQAPVQPLAFSVLVTTAMNSQLLLS